jgi:hypothetical protein
MFKYYDLAVVAVFRRDRCDLLPKLEFRKGLAILFQNQRKATLTTHMHLLTDT